MDLTMLDAIGNTPVVRLKRLPSTGSADVWVKLEGGNPTGSYKDRMALAMIEGAEAAGTLSNGESVLECTGGSTGSSLAFVCAVKGYPFTVISSDAYAREKLDSMRALGATVLVEASVGGRVTPDLWPRMRERASGLVEGGGYTYLDQFNNLDAPRGYERLGRELLEQFPHRIDVVCGAVGTAGMIMGVGAAVLARHPSARIVALEPDSSAVLSGKAPGAHGIDGTAAGFVPPLFSREVVTEVMALPESDARAMCRRLAEDEGLFAGTSTGLNVLAALSLAKDVGPGGTVGTVACDSGFKYLDGPLYR
ncbi:MAG: pyridoxal-phosphate dependent enzyme [Proteobacteria bacterium]|nr:pyridoxal-phosphate dependent enzyme [Pseudomonadota bacterium]